MALSFEGRIVVVTGSGGGIGRSYALAYAERGAKVVVNDVNAELAAKTVKEITSAGGKAVADSHSVTGGAAVIQTAIDAFGGLHILVNNAGNIKVTSLDNFTDVQWDSLVDVHLKGTISCTQAAWPIFSKQKFGRIVNTTSAAALYGFPQDCGYSAVKAGIIAFTKTIAKEGARFNIKANAVAPISDSPMSAGVLPDEIRLGVPVHFMPPLILALTHAEKGPEVTGLLFENFAGWMAEIRPSHTAPVLLQADKPLTPASVRETWATIAPDFAEHASGNEQHLRYDGRTVIVTGATSGLGPAYAKTFAKLGANVVVSGSGDAQADKLVKEIVADGGRAVGAVASGATAADTIVQTALKAFNAVHVLVTNADLPSAGSLSEISQQQWDEAITANAKATFQITRAIWPIFKGQMDGRVVLISSSAGLHGAEGNAPYASAKGVIFGFARAIAAEGNSPGVLVNVLAPSNDADVATVSALAGFLGSKANTGANGVLLEVDGRSVGQFRWERSGGHGFYHNEKLTPEAVVGRWNRITNFDDGRVSNPSKLEETLATTVANFQNVAPDA